MKKIFFVFIGILLMLAGCNLPSAAPQSAADTAAQTAVVMTLDALTQQAASITPKAQPTPTRAPVTPTPQTGTVSGTVCEPRTGPADLRLFFQLINSDTVAEVPVPQGQKSYETALPPGEYIAYAWTTDFGFGGFLCMGTSCNVDASYQFKIGAGDQLTGLDACDWSNAYNAVPYPPGVSPTARVGVIRGNVQNYPGTVTPAFTIIAFNQTTGFWYSWQPALGDTYYALAELPPGTYQVVAYDQNNLAGGAALVTLAAGQTLTVNITDWSGSYPPRP